MSDTQSNSPLDLTADARAVDTSRPVLPAGEYRMRIGKAEILEAPVDKPQKHNLRVEFNLVEPSEALNGEQIKPGFAVSRTYPLTDSWLRDIMKLVDAALCLKNKEDRPPTVVACIQQLPARELNVRLDVREDSTYGTQNEVKSYRSLD